VRSLGRKLPNANKLWGSNRFGARSHLFGHKGPGPVRPLAALINLGRLGATSDGVSGRAGGPKE
jgi:hypothetical protein